MPDFGNAGKITSRKRDGAVDVNVGNKEYLYFKVQVTGIKPILAFDCAHKRHLFNTAGSPPQQTYEWTLARSQPFPGLLNFSYDGDPDGYALGMTFTGAPIKYTYLVELRDKTDQLIKKVEDVDFESTDPSDVFFEGLSVDQV